MTEPVIPHNIDYLIPQVRTLGTIPDDKSDAYVREAIYGAIDQLYGSRLRYTRLLPEFIVSTDNATQMDKVEYPTGVYQFLPVGTVGVIRNPTQTYATRVPIISTEDTAKVTLFAAILFIQSTMTSSTSVFASWRDDEFSYSNLGSGQMYRDVLTGLRKQLDAMNLSGSATIVNFPLWGEIE